jgi:hypothetical protein
MSKHTDWKQRGIDRRDFRNSRDEPEVPRHRKKRKFRGCKKNVVGSHDFVTEVQRFYSVQICTRCGKKGNYTFHPLY